MLTLVEKTKIIKEFAKNEHDTGSSAVQIAILTKKMSILQEHLAVHKKDFSSQRGLMQMVNDRKGHLKYLQEQDSASYKDVIKRLGIRK